MRHSSQGADTGKRYNEETIMSNSMQRSDVPSRSLVFGPFLVAVITGLVLAAKGTELIGVGIGAAAGFAAALIAVVLVRQVFGRRKSGS